MRAASAIVPTLPCGIDPNLNGITHSCLHLWGSTEIVHTSVNAARTSAYATMWLALLATDYDGL